MKAARLVPGTAKPAVRAALVSYRHRNLRGSDAMLISYPKSGSTWLRFLIAHGITGEEVDFDSVRRVFPPVGEQRHGPRCLPGRGRLIRSHEPFSRFRGRTDQPIIYLVRDGRDVAVSYFHHMRRVEALQAAFEAFLPRFVSGAVDSYGPWVDHVVGAQDMQRVGANRLLLVSYEELRKDTEGVLARTLAFLGSPRSDEVIAEVVAANSRDRMRAKESSSQLLRAQARAELQFVGDVGRETWRELLDADGQARLEAALAPGLRAFDYPFESATPLA
jgi:hypothetical protein